METAFYATRSVAADSLFASMWVLVEGTPRRIEKIRWGAITEIWLDRGPKLSFRPTDSVTVVQCKPGATPVPFRFS
jgi:hypothetical protein